MQPDSSSNMSQVFTSPFAFPPHKQPGSSFDSQRFEGYPPKEYTTTGNSSFPFSNRQYEGSGWNLSPGRLSMSEDQGKGGTSPRTGGDYRFESEKKLARESLPSLSSLFGSAAQSKAAQSPYSDRQSPQFTTTSHRETRPPPTPIHPDRSFDSGSFQRPSVSGPFSYTPRTDHVQRPTFPPPPRPGQPGLRPESPRYDSHYSPREVTRTHSTASSSRWSPSENPRPEYFPRDTSSSFKYQSESHHPKQPQIHRSEAESSPVYREPAQNAPLTPNYPPTPASTVANEPVTTKDGLGPKIWTGTQFLPRFVRQAEVPGEGLCYFYDDNTHCKTVIDGEVVNAHWGVTKAGKPRKRLAIACITCREKKIKCDPDYPRCVQCEKFGRVCKFKNAPRGGQGGSPDTLPADAEDIITRPGSSRTEVEQFELETRASSHSVSPRTTLRRPTPDEESQQAKRRRLDYHDYTPVASEVSPRLSMAQTTSPATSFVEQLTRSIDSGRPNESQLNLLDRDSRIVPELLSTSLRNIRQIGYSMFPAVFESWVLSSVTKSGEDLMLIHAVLAVGAVLTSNPEYQATGAEYASISRNSSSNSPLSLQLVQSRLLLAIYYNAVSKSSEAWEFCGSAIRAAYGLKMNLELERTDSATFAYGLNRSAHAECRRRTFWSCFIMDRLTSFSAGFPSAIDSEDVFLRLPCDSVTFDSQSESQAPFFNSAEPTSFEAHSPTHMMAYLISICTVWAEIASEVYRSSHQRIIPSAQQPRSIPSISRLHAWTQHLPSTHTFSPGNFTKSVLSGHLGTFTAMHAVYHFACMKLNRFEENHDSRSPHAVYYIQEIRKHAADLLEMTKWASSNELLEVKKSSPFFTEAITTARQVLN